MNELRELYQEVILDHNRSPRNFGELTDRTGIAEGHNPLCGDRVTVFVRVQDSRIEDVMFQGCGCAISQASASLMTECVKGKCLEQVSALCGEFNQMVTSHFDPAWKDEDLEGLYALAGVREFPIRVKCATLAWHALQAAVQARQLGVSTE